MFKKIKSNINLTKASLYLEKINTGKYEEKVKYYEKLKKIEINTDIAVRIIENATYKYDEVFKDMNINSMLLLLLFEDYKEEYSSYIVENFNEYDDITKLDLLSYLSNETPYSSSNRLARSREIPNILLNNKFFLSLILLHSRYKLSIIVIFYN